MANNPAPQVEPSVDIKSRPARHIRGIPLRAFAPNAVTALALCCGLTSVRFAFDGAWDVAVALIAIAGVLDGIDGRIARLLNANTRFGAELDSLSDVIAFGVAPAFANYFWALQYAPKFGWTASLALTVACALRLARFNAAIDSDDQPHKSAGFNTGVPAPMGAALALTPLAVHLATGWEDIGAWYIIMPWVIFVAFLMISDIATYAWSSIRLRREWRLLGIAMIALLGSALVTAPWLTLLGLTLLYLATIPFSMLAYRRVKLRRALTSAAPPA